MFMFLCFPLPILCWELLDPIVAERVAQDIDKRNNMQICCEVIIWANFRDLNVIIWANPMAIIWAKVSLSYFYSGLSRF